MRVALTALLLLLLVAAPSSAFRVRGPTGTAGDTTGAGGAPGGTGATGMTGSSGSATGGVTGPPPGKTEMIEQTMTLAGLGRDEAEAHKEALAIGIGAALAVPPENIEITRVEASKGSSDGGAGQEEGLAEARRRRRRRLLELELDKAMVATSITSITYEVAVTADLSRAEVEGKMAGKNTAAMTARLQVALDTRAPGEPPLSVRVMAISEPTVETKTVTAEGDREMVVEQIKIVTRDTVDALQNATEAAGTDVAAPETAATPGLTLGVLNVNQDMLFDHEEALKLNVARTGGIDGTSDAADKLEKMDRGMAVEEEEVAPKANDETGVASGSSETGGGDGSGEATAGASGRDEAAETPPKATAAKEEKTDATGGATGGGQ